MSESAAAGFILLKDETGYKFDGYVKSTIKKFFGAANSKVNILRGELVEEYNSQSDAKFNYVLHREPSIFLHCSDVDVAPLFLEEEFLLLKGIEKPMDRFEAFTEGRHDLGRSLHKDSEIFVNCFKPGYADKITVKGIVCFKGKVAGLPGIQFGVELMEKNTSISNTDGTFNGQWYFNCRVGCGAFVSLDKLSNYSSSSFPKKSPTQERVKPLGKPDMDYPANNTRSKIKPGGDCPTDFVIGDRVRFYDKKGSPVEGVVKWVGNSTATKQFEFVYVGIQTDDDIFIQDFDQSRPGLGHLIKEVPLQKRLFLPQTLLEKIKLKDEEKKILEASITSAMAKEREQSREEFVREQSKYLQEIKANKEQEELNQLKSAGVVTEEEVIQQAEALRKIQEESKHRKEGDGSQERKHPHHANPDKHREVDQFKAYSNHGQGRFGDHPNFQEDLHSRSGNGINRSFSSSSTTGSSVDKQFEEGSNVASTGYSPSMDISVGSMIQVPIAGNDTAYQYGVVRWIGNIPNVAGFVAGIELDERMEHCTNGSWKSPEGHVYQFFTCGEGRGLYYPLSKLKPDERVSGMGSKFENPLASVPEIVKTQEGLRVPVNTDIGSYVGIKKGIQGHQNSCYLDATVFGLFALSQEFDEMFLRDSASRVGQILWQKIVNPLRKFGVVKYESVMELRMELDQLGKMSGITHAEKDPEEFLNLMFKSSLKVKPFISIRRPFGIESEYFVQLFLELSDSPKPAFIGSLLNEMFLEQNIRFTQVPSKLLIQVPRHGKKFQSFQKIIPELTLDVSRVTDSVSSGSCIFCGEQIATKICEDCYSEFGSKNPMAFCDSCYKTCHTAKRKDHNYKSCDSGPAALELLSVLCIETSHYVCFTRQDNRWLFFDSMSDRQHDQYNIPKVEDCSKYLNNWVYPSDKKIEKLISTKARDLPECVRRFTQDVYLCVYIQNDLSMY